MNRRKTALGAAAAGTAAGVVGLVLLATPAGAGGAPPALPPVTADALVQSVLTAKVPAMSGSVKIDESLGLPIPVLPSGSAGGDAARVYSDGQGKGRIALSSQMSETTIVADGTDVWIWESGNRSVRKASGEHKPEQVPEELADPSSAAKQLVGAMREDSTVTVDGTERVAGRPVYKLVLTPNASEKTLLREVRVAIDSELRVPLQLEVLANGQSTPALKIGFTEFEPGAQNPSLFQFTVPPGATVTEEKPGDHLNPKAAQDLLTQLDPKIVGRGWDTVLVGKIPADVLSTPQGEGKGDRPDAMSLLRQFAKQVSGPYGTGWVISTKVGTALITADGRAALGAVPEQVLVDALGQVK